MYKYNIPNSTASGSLSLALIGVFAATITNTVLSASQHEASRSNLFHLPRTASPAVERALLLAVDERAIPFRENVTLFLSKPRVRPEPVLAPSPDPDAPDNVATHFYGTVLHENGRFRMWYNANYRTDVELYGLAESPVCYAESSDGINWTRPKLGQVEWRGNRANNIVALGRNPAGRSAGVSVIRDDQDPRPERRYKIVWSIDADGWVVRTAVSSDGIRWTDMPTEGFGSEFAALYRHNGLYIVNGHIKLRGEGDRPEGRQAYAVVSPDFEDWLPGPAPSFRTPEPLKKAGYGSEDGTGLYTQVHLGVGAASFGNVAVGLWGMWHHTQPRWGEGGLSCDLGLVISHDGIHFDEVVKGLPYIRSEESPADPVPGRTYPTILCQSNSIINIGDETWIYHGRWRNAEFHRPEKPGQGPHFSRNYWGGVALATIPRDRWGALGLFGDKDAGSVWTTAVTLPGSASLQMNASGLHGLRVEVTDDQFRPVQGFENGRATASSSDSLDASVNWRDQSLQELAGRSVRFRIHFTRSSGGSPRLYALSLQRQ